MKRNQSELIPHFYSNTAPELGKYNTDDLDLMHFFKKTNKQLLIKKIFYGFKFDKMCKNLIFNKKIHK